MSTIAELLIKLGVDAEDLDKVDSRMEEWDKKLRKAGDRMTDVGKKMTLGVTTPIVAGFGLAIKAGAEEQQQMDLLANTIRTNVAGATDEMIAANEDWIASMQDATAIADGEMRDAMNFLLASGMDIEEAQKALTVAMDASTVTGKDLGAITEALGKAHNGNIGALGRLGVATKNAAGETLTYDQVLDNLNKTMGGSAVKAADSAAGRTEKLKLKMADLAENVGIMLLPILDKLTGWLTKIVDWFSDMSPAAQKVIMTLAAVAAAVGPVLIVAGKLVSAFGQVMKAFSLLSKLMMANPWVLLIAAVVALVVLIVQNWDKIVAFLKKAWDWIKKAAGALWEWVKQAFQRGVDFIKNLFLNFTPLGLIIKHFDKIKAVATEVKDWVVEKFNAIVDFFKNLPSRIASAAAGMWDGIKNAFKAAVNWIIEKWNRFGIKISAKIPSWIPGLGGKTLELGFNTPNIPKMHGGGVVPQVPGGEMLAILESGETVTQKGGGAGGPTYIFYGDVYGDEGFMRKVREANHNLSRLGIA